jgi:hypothetical protein
MSETTKEQFDSFKASVYQYQSELGLMDWRIYCFLEKLPDGTFAEVETIRSAMVANISLNSYLAPNNVQFDDTEIAVSAYHEVLEILLSELKLVARTEFDDPEDRENAINHAAHAIIQRLIHQRVWELALDPAWETSPEGAPVPAKKKGK